MSVSLGTRRPLVAGNWKMNTTPPEGMVLARAIAERCGQPGAVDVAMLPPFTHLWALRELLEGTAIELGAQDVYWQDAGAFTGEVSPVMLAGWCDLVLVGHSERRHVFGETDAETGAKFAAATRHGLRVILAVGERESERDEGQTMAVVERQLDAALASLGSPPLASAWVVAYEPVWAIGTGRTASPDQAQEVCAHIRGHLGARGGDAPRVIYGGSVTAENAAELFSQPDIDGGLIGGASLRADAFCAIVAAAAERPA